jgi:2-(1,2-epoxy-1,2-dihydrophenyl)acetyl-CoA isomerase
MTLVRFDIDGEIGTITLNRPDKLNALSNELAGDLVDALKRAAASTSVRALVVTGAGRTFCAGGDIDTMRRHLDAQDWMSIRRLLEAGAAVASALESMPKPTIAAVNGPAVGAGGSLALACDLRIASDTASFGLVFNRLGLHPDWGGTYFLPRIVGAGKALELILSGDIVDANEGLRLGIFNRVVPGAELAATAREVATTLGAKPPLAVTLARRAVHESGNMTLQGVLDLEIENQLCCFKTADAKEGVNAFLEKRRAVFRGV